MDGASKQLKYKIHLYKRIWSHKVLCQFKMINFIEFVQLLKLSCKKCTRKSLLQLGKNANILDNWIDHPSYTTITDSLTMGIGLYKVFLTLSLYSWNLLCSWTKSKIRNYFRYFSFPLSSLIWIMCMQFWIFWIFLK